ncbi:MAG: hypothetical protein FWF08_08065 [Oscillospiraceae bacterium]|nr:hypothetical protein [Oscillospiraceae bacterium]
MISYTKINPVKKDMAPKYPDQYSVELDRFLLANRPLRWNAAPVAGTVLSAVVMLGLAGCSRFGATMGVPTNVAWPSFFEQNDNYDSDTATLGVPPAPTTLPAVPLFEHGEGTGVIGCIVVNAPIFLSESDAFAIIKDEFSKLDLNAYESNVAAHGIEIPDISYDPKLHDDDIKTKPGDHYFDFAVEDKNIVMEYVSKDDLDMWTSQENGWSSVTTFNFKKNAKVLNDSLNENYIYNAHGVFYDPAETFDINDTINARERSYEALREQVKDFIAWLSAQGII